MVTTVAVLYIQKWVHSTNSIGIATLQNKVSIHTFTSMTYILTLMSMKSTTSCLMFHNKVFSVKDKRTEHKGSAVPVPYVCVCQTDALLRLLLDIVSSETSITSVQEVLNLIDRSFEVLGKKAN